MLAFWFAVKTVTSAVKVCLTLVSVFASSQSVSLSVRLCKLSRLLSGSTLIIRLVDRAISLAF